MCEYENPIPLPVVLFAQKIYQNKDLLMEQQTE